MATQKKAPNQSAARSEALPVHQLTFDSENPRFPKEIASGPTDKLLERFIRDERLQEIVDSIGNHGFFPGEPLLVVSAEEKDEFGDDLFKVVEGNRRLAALKLLSGELTPPSGRTNIAEAIEKAEFRPQKVPCLIFDNEQEVLRYLGFRHITGVKAWGALQKARYAARLWETYKNKPLDEGLKLLAKEIGSRSDYVGQMLTSLAIYDRAEKSKFFGLDLSPDDIEFSVLSTALSYANITDYLNLDSRTDLRLKGIDDKATQDLFDWLFVSTNKQKPVVSESRDLRKLAAIVNSADAVKELKANRQLNEAYELSKGPEVALADLLRVANLKINSALSMVWKANSVSEQHELLAMQISKAARALLNEIQESVASGNSQVAKSKKTTARKAD
ncbi:ParB N-terminal domain-containing protein [Acidovorax sp. 1608163]|uniref:ParB N-terminal domain-containing protein n=1 Tax=Acidovorax sp. 1608163 TaxID=2478662 RepID=UPI0013CE8504|nr:ParB N-terminal domain-containing protein [Acidovorax sp. 1608163]